MTFSNSQAFVPSREPMHRQESYRCSLRAVLAANIAGIGGQASANQDAAAVKAHNELLQSVVNRLMAHDGWLFAVRGYQLLALFDSAISSLHCALALQQHLHSSEPCASMGLRLGLHMGEVHFENDLPSGEALAVARALESIADPGGIMVSGLVVDIVSSQISAKFEERDASQLKETPNPVRAFAVAPPAERARAEPTLVVDTASDQSREPDCQTANTGSVYWMSRRTAGTPVEASTPVEPDIADEAPASDQPPRNGGEPDTHDAQAEQPEPTTAQRDESSKAEAQPALFANQPPSHACLESLTGALAVHLGPISKLIVGQSLKDASSLDHLIALVEKHIPHIEGRFLFRLRASHICETFAGDPF